jgi:WD40 repeat protein
MFVNLTKLGHYWIMNKLIHTCILLACGATATFAQKTVTEPIVILPGSQNDIHTLCAHVQSDYIAAGDWDKKILIYKNDSSLTLTHTLDRHLAPITALGMSRDGKVLVSGSQDKSIIVWDSAFNFKGSLDGHNSKVNALLIDPSKRFLISGGEDRNIILWNLEQGKQLKKIDNGAPIHMFAQSNDIKSLYVVGAEPVIKQYTIGTWQIARTFAGHTDVVNAIAISPNSQYMISGSNDKTARIWDLKTGKELRKLPVDCWKVQTVAFTRDSRYAATGCNDGTIKIWEVETGKLVANIQSSGENIKAILFSKFGNQLLSSSMLRGRSDFGVRVWPTFIPSQSASSDNAATGMPNVKSDSIPSKPKPNPNPPVKK